MSSKLKSTTGLLVEFLRFPLKTARAMTTASSSSNDLSQHDNEDAIRFVLAFY